MTNALLESDIPDNPLELFDHWYRSVTNDPRYFEAGAMTLCTCTPTGQPSARMVLFKGLDEGRFTFYSNYESRKADELADNPQVALVFWWGHHEKQIRIEGTVEKLSAETSAAYFHSRPRGSQLGAIASPQSRVVESRQWLESAMTRVTNDYPDDIPTPDFWGGYAVTPTIIEFWQGQRNRLHDRIEYSLNNDQWVIRRLAP